MVSVGGQVRNVTEPDYATAMQLLPDPWPQGLGIFDLTTMEWKDGYDAAAPAYVTPAAVKAHYQKNGREPYSWSNDIVKAWFTKTELDRSTPNSTSSTPRSSSSRSNVGAIAGGTIGGVGALALAASIAFCVLRRRRRKICFAAPKPDSYDYDSRIPGLEYVHESEALPAELQVREVATSELPSGAQPTRYEM